ncbi:phytoene/squalene synthase family protein [Streptomyces sp. NPDC001941]|uniref:phytoene/squalene synthase family protein n=1 Tax=Streptomyces sp. NPDC001941 TaxID=3154659 RepID=UPI0033307023
MNARELDVAGITDPGLRDAYLRCRRLNARHGKTYYLATRLLPLERRAAVHALYGFARWADDIVDTVDGAATTRQRRRALDALEGELDAGPHQGAGARPVIRALLDTRARYGIAPSLFHDFLASMRSDLTVTSYARYADLRAYMHGSAAVIGLQMLPVLGTVVPPAEAEPHAAALGVAFQLTNFLRDVGEDLDRGRVYLPLDLLAAHGAGPELLRWSRRTGRDDPRITAALKDAEHLTRRCYRDAVPGLAMLDPRSRPCVRTAFVLYRGILDAIAADGYQVVHRRAVVPRRRRALVALDGFVSRARPRNRRAPDAPCRPRPGTALRVPVLR